MARHNGAFPQSQHLGARDRSTAIKASLVDIVSSRPELHSVTFSEGVETNIYLPQTGQQLPILGCGGEEFHLLRLLS